MLGRHVRTHTTGCDNMTCTNSEYTRPLLGGGGGGGGGTGDEVTGKYMYLVCNYMWQSRIEIEYYSVAYFERITEFDTL